MANTEMIMDFVSSFTPEFIKNRVSGYSIHFMCSQGMTVMELPNNVVHLHINLHIHKNLDFGQN
jgi:hypothetical protein